jgi:hypothetical protein
VNGIRKSQTRREAERGQELAVRALELYRTGLSFRDVALRIDRSVSLTHRIIKRELAEIASQRSEMAGLALEEIVERERLIISEAMAIALAPCRECRDLQLGSSCPACKGDGRGAPPKLRLEAMDRVRRSDEVLMRLFGLGVETTAVTISASGFRDDLEGIPDEQLDRLLQPLLTPLTIESNDADAPPERESG